MFKVGASWTIITSTLKWCQYTLTLVFPGKTSGQLRLSATVEVCSRRRLLWIGRNYSSIHRKWPWGANKGWDRCQCCQKLILWRLSLRRTTLMILKKRGNDKESHEQRSKAPPKAKAKVGPWSRFFLATLILQRDELRGRFGHFRLRPPGGCDAAVEVRLLKGVRQQREKRRAAAPHMCSFALLFLEIWPLMCLEAAGSAAVVKTLDAMLIIFIFLSFSSIVARKALVDLRRGNKERSCSQCWWCPSFDCPNHWKSRSSSFELCAPSAGWWRLIGSKDRETVNFVIAHLECTNTRAVQVI